MAMMGWPVCMSAFLGHTVIHRCLVDASVCTLLGCRWCEASSDVMPSWSWLVGCLPGIPCHGWSLSPAMCGIGSCVFGMHSKRGELANAWGLTRLACSQLTATREPFNTEFVRV